EQIFVDEVGQLLVFFVAGQLGGLDLAADISLFVGQEQVFVTVAGDEAFLFQALKRGFDAAAQGQFVGVYFVDAESDEVVQGALDQLDIADHEQGAQDLYVEGIEAAV